MRLLIMRIVGFGWCCLCLSLTGLGLEGTTSGTKPSADTPRAALHAAQWLPATTQGFARIVDFPRFLERWKKTQLGQLAEDKRLEDFWKEQRKAIEGRFAEAGWQLSVTVDDIAKVASGQAAVAWMSKPQETQKPYAVALIVDVQGKTDELADLMQRIDADFKARQASAATMAHEGLTITQYTLPRGPGELVIREAFYAVADEFFFATDELPALKDLLASQKSGRSDALAAGKLFQQATGRLAVNGPQSDVEYFVQPIGLAKLLRSISGKPVATQTDILKVLENQGFSKLAAVVGRVRLADDSFDIFHDAFVQTEPPLPVSVQVLDFPNVVSNRIPSWVSAEAASFLATAWNAKEAFWKVESIVDEVAGQPGVFDSVIEGIQTDPVGPQIDIKNEVLPYITSEIYSMTEVVQPITPDSRRSLIAIRLDDPAGKLAAVLERAMKNEPDATPEDFQDFRIWKVNRPEEDEESLSIEGDFDFGGKKSSKATKPQEEDQPLLSNWAITVYSKKSPQGEAIEQYLMFASHAEMIKQAITISQTQKPSPLDQQDDVARVISNLQGQGKGEAGCLWEINRTERAFRMQYELFRQDKLPQSRSILATVIDRILRPKDELKEVNQRVKGDRLPPFDQIREFFMPSGSRVIAHDDGWAFQGFVLAKPSSGLAKAKRD